MARALVASAKFDEIEAYRSQQSLSELAFCAKASSWLVTVIPGGRRATSPPQRFVVSRARP